MPQLVKQSQLSMATVDTAVGRLIYVRMRLGEWDPVGDVPFRDESVYSHDLGCQIQGVPRIFYDLQKYIQIIHVFWYELVRTTYI